MVVGLSVVHYGVWEVEWASQPKTLGALEMGACVLYHDNECMSVET